MPIFPVVVVFFVLSSSLAMAAPHDCARAVAAKMTQLKVGPAQIIRTVFVDIRDGGCCDFLQGYEAWVDLKQCGGSVVMKLSLQCGIDESYTRGACEIGNLKNFR